ncbi:DUF3995 domain-containing protein [Fulvivirga lutimaris]|uniref:DUF3995 domain-containing protein n=1 Tax=Fulvivirga lutimaris TaxID=1819566 RepID=UPI0012BD3D99|nr:DUF3995 domain-containing protein [Fulvivirga lutimaris]MTI38603.1 DUF3995 domain-containing protein [Fulvivirga lutimaris]
MIFFARLLLSLIFLVLSVLHFYWATGGKWGLDNSVPTNLEGKKMLKTSLFSCIVVGSGLLIFSLFYFLPLADVEIPNLAGFVKWLVPSVFLLRSIGDFRYVGFFKSVRTTHFAQLDTTYFSPLCVLLAGLGFIVAIV